MDLVTVRELYRNREEYLDKEVTIGGWVRSIRDSKTFGFIVVNDGSFFENLQVVYHDNMENFGEISKLNVGAAIIVKGTLVATPQAKQPFEIQATEVVVEEQEFAESKAASDANVGSFHAAPSPAPASDAGDGFMNIPDGIDEELPFN